MSSKIRILSIALLLGMLFLGGLVDLSVQAQQSPPPSGGAPGARQSLEVFFRSLAAGDLVLLSSGGALSGTVQGEQFTVNPSSGQAQTLAKANIAMMTFGSKTDQVVLMSGDLVSGSVQVDNLTITLPTGTQVSIPKAQIAATIFKITPPAGGEGSTTTPQQRQGFFKLFRSLQAQNLFQLFAKSLTSYDLAVFPGQQQQQSSNGNQLFFTANPILSGKIVNTQFVFNTNLFGSQTFKASDVASIQLAAAGSNPGSDFITLKTGDRLSGTLDDSNPIQFQAVAMTDSQGQPVTLTFKHGDISQVVFRLPASAFGGGKGPGFQGGPGH
jgi:hypothetical protein